MGRNTVHEEANERGRTSHLGDTRGRRNLTVLVLPVAPFPLGDPLDVGAPMSARPCPRPRTATRLRPRRITGYGSLVTLLNSTPRWVRACCVAAASAWLTCPAPAAAQRLIGTVVHPDGRTPAAGVIVVARDSTGRDISQTVTGAEGQFTLFVDSATTLSLHLLREGFAPTDGESRRLTGDEVVELIAVLGNRPVPRLPFPRGASSCGRASPEQRAAVDLILEEARKSFIVAQAGIGRADITSRFATYDHRTAKNGEDTLRSVVRRGRGALPSLYRATTTEELETGGFFALLAGERVFRALEPAQLASEWFRRTHCFTLVTQGDSVVQLVFRPARERRGLVDVEGTMRFDATTRSLRDVTYRYQGLPAEERASGAGAWLEFARLPNGDRIVTQWGQRVPLLGYRLSDGAMTMIRTTMTLIDITGHRSVGGRVTAVMHETLPLFIAAPVDPAVARTPFGLACPERLGRPNTGAARGAIPPKDSAALAGILVRVTWEDPVVVDRTVFTKREQVREALTDDAGAFVVCDLPTRRDFTLRWELRGEERSFAFTLPAAGAVVSVSPPVLQ